MNVINGALVKPSGGFFVLVIIILQKQKPRELFVVYFEPREFVLSPHFSSERLSCRILTCPSYDAFRWENIRLVKGGRSIFRNSARSESDTRLEPYRGAVCGAEIDLSDVACRRSSIFFFAGEGGPTCSFVVGSGTTDGD